MSPEEGVHSLYSTFRPHADLFLATVIHSLSRPFSPSKPSFLSALIYACRMVCWGLPTGRDVVHHAPRIRFWDPLDCFITLSLDLSTTEGCMVTNEATIEGDLQVIRFQMLWSAGFRWRWILPSDALLFSDLSRTTSRNCILHSALNFDCSISFEDPAEIMLIRLFPSKTRLECTMMSTGLLPPT
jgi:hypothetical protein